MPTENNVAPPEVTAQASEPIEQGTPQVTEPEVNAPSEQVEAPNEPTENTDDVRIVIDPVTGERTLELGNQENEQAGKEQGEQQENEPTNNATPPQPEAPQYYSDTELMQAYVQNTVNEARISPEQRAFLEKRDNMMLERQQAEQQRQLAMQQAEQQLMANRKASLDRIATQAKAEALKQAGLTEADLANMEYVENGEEKLKKYNELYGNMVSTMQYQMVQNEVLEAQRIQQYQTGIMEIGNFMYSEQMKEPHYNEIVAMLDKAKENMPYKDAKQYEEVEQHLANGICTPQDIALARKYYDECKKIIYQQKNGVTTVPQRTAVPQVEKSGVPHVESNEIDVGAMRGMNQSDRNDYVQNWFKQHIN